MKNEVTEISVFWELCGENISYHIPAILQEYDNKKRNHSGISTYLLKSETS